MGNIFNRDFRDFLSALNDQQVRYILVGGFSVIIHGYPRTTGDMDIWVERTVKNYLNLTKAFHHFGMLVFDMMEDNFMAHPRWDVFTFGNPPVAINLMVKVKGLEFEGCYSRSILFKENGLLIRTIHKDDLIKAKNSVRRPKDLDDLENLL